MFCEKCGSNNPVGAKSCAMCGEKMPDTKDGNGFKDILSCEVPKTGSDGGVSNKSVEKLEKKLNNVIKAEKRLFILTFASIALSLILLISLVIVGLSNSYALEEHINEYNNVSKKTEKVDEKSQPNESTTDNPINIDIEDIEKTLENIGESINSKTN